MFEHASDLPSHLQGFECSETRRNSLILGFTLQTRTLTFLYFERLGLRALLYLCICKQICPKDPKILPIKTLTLW